MFIFFHNIISGIGVALISVGMFFTGANSVVTSNVATSTTPIATSSTQTEIAIKTVATSTIVVPSKTVAKPVQPVTPAKIQQPIIQSIQVVAPVQSPVSATTSNVPSTSTIAQSVPFVITSPVAYAANSIWKENTKQTISWTPYAAHSVVDYIDYYQIVMGNTIADVSQQVPDSIIVLPASYNQTSITFTIPKLLEEFNSKSGILPSEINNSFYVKVNAIRGYGGKATVVVSTPNFPFTIATIVNMTSDVTPSPNTMTTIPYNGSITINWTSPNATSCNTPLSVSSANGIFPVNIAGNIPTSGLTSAVNLTQNTTFSITCTGPGGETSASYTVNVQQPILPPPNSICAGSMLVGWQIDACAKEYPALKWGA